MKNIRIAAVALAAWFGTSVIATAQTFNWTGFYVGGTAGWLSGNIEDGFFTDTPTTIFSPGRSNQAAAGFYGGYQFQSGNWVLGAEAGFDAALGNGDASNPIGPNCNIGSGTYTCDGRLNNIFRAGGRLGWASDRWLAYGTGGYARGLVQTWIFKSGAPINAASGYSDGWYAGGGIEYAVLKNLFLAIEYRHYDFGTFQLGDDVTSNIRQLSATTDSVMARLTIKIGP